MLLVMGVSLYTSRVVLEILGFTDYGVYSVVGGVVAIFGFLNGSMSGASSRFLSFEVGRKDETRLNNIFNALLVSHLGIAGIVVILSETVGLWLLYDKLVVPDNQMRVIQWVYQISILSSVLSIIIVPYTSVLIAHEKMNVYAYVGLAEAILKLGIVFLLMVIPGSKLLIYSLLVFGVQMLVNTFYLFHCHRDYTCCHIKIHREKKLYREIFGFVGSDLIGNISVLAQGQGLNILLNIFFGPVVNAARSITYQVQGALQQFSNNFTTALRPQIIKLCAVQDFDEMFVLLRRGSYFSYYLLWMLILPVLLNSRYILTLWLGRFPDYTIPFLNIVLVISLVQSLKSPRTMVFHGLGRVKFVNIVVGGILILTFPVSYIALKFGAGPTSVFIISLISILVSEVVSVGILKKYVEFSSTRYFLNVHLRCAMVSCISGIICYMYILRHPTTTFIDLLFSCMITTIFSIAAILLFGMDTSTRRLVFSTVKKLSKKLT